MGCRKLAYYEIPTSQLKVVPEESRSVVIIAYRIELENGKFAQRWFTPDPAEQFHNPYLAMGRTKRKESLWERDLASGQPAGAAVMYVDPDGEWVFLIPHISFGNGSFDLGLTVGFGFYGGASVQATVGHTFYKEGNDNTYATVGGSLAGFTASVGYGTQTGYTAGVGFGFGPPGVNSNMTSIGVSWSQNYGANVSALGASYGSGGFGFSPTFGYSHQVKFERQATYDSPLTASLAVGPGPGGIATQVNLEQVYIYPQEITGHVIKAMFGPGEFQPLRAPRYPRNTTWDILDPATARRNLLGTNYIGSANPRTFAGNYDYRLSPRSLPDLIAMQHDLRYDDLRIKGGSGLFTSNKAIPADLVFARDMMKIASMPYVSAPDRIVAGTTGAFIGSIAMFKLNRLMP